MTGEAVAGGPEAGEASKRRWFFVSKWVLLQISRIFWFLRIRGLENVPREGPTILASNHASFLDPLFMGTAVPRFVRFMARDSLGEIPVVGWWMLKVGTVFIDRNAPQLTQLKTMVQFLRQGETMTVFPEGTRTRDGALGPFKPGIRVLVKKSGAAVVPVGIQGSFHALPPGRRFPRLFRRCSVRYGAPMTADEVLADGGLEALRRRVAHLSGQGT